MPVRWQVRLSVLEGVIRHLEGRVLVDQLVRVEAILQCPTAALEGAAVGSIRPPAVAEEVVLEAMCGLSFSQRRARPLLMLWVLGVLEARQELEVLLAATEARA